MRGKENIATESITQSYEVNSSAVGVSLTAIYQSLASRDLGGQLQTHSIRAFLGSEQINKKKINIYSFHTNIYAVSF